MGEYMGVVMGFGKRPPRCHLMHQADRSKLENPPRPPQVCW